MAEVLEEVAKAVSKALDAFFRELVEAAIQPLVDWLAPRLRHTPPVLDNPTVFTVWQAVLCVVNACLVIVVIAIGFRYMLQVFSENAQLQLRAILPQLVIAVILAHASIYICQLALDFNDALTQAILTEQDVRTVGARIAAGMGGCGILLAFVAVIMLILVCIILALRTALIFFTTAMMPAACVLWLFEPTKPYALRIVRIFAEMTFLQFFNAVAIKLCIGLFATAAEGAYIQNWAVAIAMLALLLAMPFIISTLGGYTVTTLGFPAPGSTPRRILYLGALTARATSRLRHAAGGARRASYGSSSFRTAAAAPRTAYATRAVEPPAAAAAVTLPPARYNNRSVVA
jgi:hypothetical protein